MDSQVVLEGWPDDDAPVAYDLRCLVCGETGRLNGSDAFVGQVRVFLDQHRH